MKIVGKVLLGLVAVLGIAVGAIYALSTRALGKTYNVTPAPLTVAGDSATIARGEHLVEAVVVCRDCHGEKLAGMAMAMGPMGTFVAPNLTSGRGGVAGAAEERWVRAVRHGVRTDGSPLIFMPSEAYRYLSDADLGAILAYIRALPPVDTTLPATTVGPIGRLILARNPEQLVAAEVVDHGTARPAAVTPERTAAYGEYLANIAGCTSCHTATLKGGLQLGPPGTPPTADISGTGAIAQWTEEQFITTIRTGVRPDGRPINPFMPWGGYRHMTDEELGAIFLFLRERGTA